MKKEKKNENREHRAYNKMNTQETPITRVKKHIIKKKNLKNIEYEISTHDTPEIQVARVD